MIRVAIALKNRSNNRIDRKARGLIGSEIQSKRKNLVLPQWSRQLLSEYFFPLGESNLLESSSSRLETDERANYKSFLLDFVIELRSKLVEMELTFSPSLDGVRSLIRCSFNEDLLHSMNPDLQSQTPKTNLPRDH